MRWLTYFILVYIALGLQSGLAAYLTFYGAAPNLVLLAAVFIAINAPRDAALLACFVLGLMQDVLTLEPLGLYALSYGLVAMFIVSTQEIVYREHPLTHFSVTFMAGLMTSAMLLLHGWIHPPGAARIADSGAPLTALRLAPSALFATALYTAVLAPIVIGVLQRLKRLFVFQAPRRRRSYV